MRRNIETIQALYQSFLTGDMPRILAKLHPDVEWEHDHVDHGIPWLVARRGRDQVPLFFQALGALEFLAFAPEAFLSDDTHVAVFVRHEARVRATGHVMRGVEIHYWTFDDAGLVTRMKHFVDTAEDMAVLQRASA